MTLNAVDRWATWLDDNWENVWVEALDSFMASNEDISYEQREQIEEYMRESRDLIRGIYRVEVASRKLKHDNH